MASGSADTKRALAAPGKSRRFALAAIGSRGDLNPVVAIGRELARRGHAVTIATLNRYRGIVESAGLRHATLRPDTPLPPEQSERLHDVRRGGERIMREIILPAMPEIYEDLLEAARNADLLAVQSILLPAPMVAARLGIPWATLYYMPAAFNSVYDPPILPPLPWLHSLQRMTPAIPRFLNPIFGRIMRPWYAPLDALRAREGLPREDGNLLLGGFRSPYLNLALFSSLIGPRQRDWPDPTVTTGFVFDDEDAGEADAELLRFMEGGEPPVVVTLGTSAFRHMRGIFEVSLEAGQRVGRRVVLLTGNHAENRPAAIDGSWAYAISYARYSAVFPRAGAVIHAGAIGALAETMRAGKPMLILPIVSPDQPDNAFRARKLGISRTLSLRNYTPASAAGALRALLNEPGYADAAAEVGRRVRQEQGVVSACEAMELAIS